jgi:hypothetical protein
MQQLLRKRAATLQGQQQMQSGGNMRMAADGCFKVLYTLSTLCILSQNTPHTTRVIIMLPIKP